MTAPSATHNATAHFALRIMRPPLKVSILVGYSAAHDIENCDCPDMGLRRRGRAVGARAVSVVGLSPRQQPAVLAEPRGAGGARDVQDQAGALRHLHLHRAAARPGVIAAGQSWKTVWDWQGNNADGPIAGDGGTILFANNDASNVMRMDPATGLATVIHKDVNTGGAVSRSKNGALFVLSRGLNPAVV